MNFNLIKQQDGSFIPAYPSDWEKAKKFKVGEEYNYSHKKIRNPKYHRKYFAMMRMLFDNQDLIDDSYIFRKYMEMKAGWYTVTQIGDKEMILPKSINFEKMDEDEFQDLFGRVQQVAFEKFALENSEIELFLIDFL